VGILSCRTARDATICVGCVSGLTHCPARRRGGAFSFAEPRKERVSRARLPRPCAKLFRLQNREFWFGRQSQFVGHPEGRLDRNSTAHCSHTVLSPARSGAFFIPVGPREHAGAIEIVSLLFLVVLRSVIGIPRPAVVPPVQLRHCTPVSVSRGGRSFQFGRASAPTIPQLVHTMRGPKVGTATSSGHRSTPFLWMSQSSGSESGLHAAAYRMTRDHSRRFVYRLWFGPPRDDRTGLRPCLLNRAPSTLARSGPEVPLFSGRVSFSERGFLTFL
jgi:hypothetical protein